MRAKSAVVLFAVLAGLAGPLAAQEVADQPQPALPQPQEPAAPQPSDAVAADPAPADAAVADPAPADAAVAADPQPAQAVVAEPATPEVAPADGRKALRDERLWTCETSISGERTEVRYVRDEEFSSNVGRVEKNFAGWGKISCPGYITLREILRRNAMGDDGSYCLLWDNKNNTYIGAQQGPRKGNAVCSKTFCERVNTTRAATFRNANAMAVAGYDAITQRPGAAVLAATSGSMVGTLEAAGVAAMGVAASPVAVGSMVIGSAAVGGTMWYCSEG